MSAEADVVIGAGDFASVHEGLEETIGGAGRDRDADRARPRQQRDRRRPARRGRRLAGGDGPARRGDDDRRGRVLRPRRRHPGHALGMELRPRRRGGGASCWRPAPRARCWSSTRRPRATATAAATAPTSAARRCCAAIEAEAAAAGRLRPHPRVLGLRERGRRDAGPQPRPDRHLDRDLGPPVAAERPKRAGLVLATLILVAGVANLNLAVANVALPDIGKAFDAGQTMVDLVAVGYSLGLAASVLYLGAVGDRYGRKTLLLLGMALLDPGLAPGRARAHDRGPLRRPRARRRRRRDGLPDHAGADHGALVGARRGPRRSRSGRRSAAASRRSGRCSPAALLEGFDWGSVFIVTAPLAAIALFFAWQLVPAHVNETTEPVDHLGGILSIAMVGDAGAGDQPGARTGQGHDRDRSSASSPSPAAAPSCCASAAPRTRSTTSRSPPGRPSGSRRWPGSSSSAR